jgi:amidase
VAELLSCLDSPVLKGDVEIFVLSDAWSSVNSASAPGLKSALERLEDCAARQSRELSLKRICSDHGGNDLHNWYQTYFELFCMESWSSIGTWVEDRKPDLGLEARANVHRARMTDRSESAKFFKRRELFSQAINEFLGHNKIICIPASSELAPKKGFVTGVDDPGNYQQTMLSLASLSAIGRLAQLTIPLAETDGVPVGLSLLAADESILLGLLKQIST